ncbi:MAG TPA: hypothetical protein VGL74_09045 [Terriglobales bacterium]|jgi:hypothetical protein
MRLRLFLSSLRFSLRSSLAFAAFAAVAVIIVNPRAFAQDIFVTPVPNAPFSGVIHVERSIIRPNGSVINLKTSRVICRDSQGRIRNEMHALIPVSVAANPPLIRVLLYDPETRLSTFLNVQRRTYRTMSVSHPPQAVPPRLLQASPAASAMPSNDFTKEEDLGYQEIEGLQAHGVRDTQIIPAEKSSTGKEIVITDEYWYSDELRINLMIKHSDPRTGAVVMKVAQINRVDPDPSLLTIPEGYKPVSAVRAKK